MIRWPELGSTGMEGPSRMSRSPGANWSSELHPTQVHHWEVLFCIRGSSVLGTGKKGQHRDEDSGNRVPRCISLNEGLGPVSRWSWFLLF